MTDQNRLGKADPAVLVRGTFHDDFRHYRVRVSCVDAPDSFQVLTGDREDIVLIVSGLNSGDIKMTWGPFWRSFKPSWQTWVEESAFRVFNTGRHSIESAPITWRYCNG